MQPEPPRPKPFWTERRALWATFLVPILIAAGLIVYAQPWRPAYIQSVDRCNLGVDQICLDANIYFNRAVVNDSLRLLVVAFQNGTETSSDGYANPNSFSPPDHLVWSFIIPVNAAIITTYRFQFTLFVNDAQADARTVGYQGG